MAEDVKKKYEALEDSVIDLYLSIKIRKEAEVQLIHHSNRWMSIRRRITRRSEGG